ncbi:MAG: hypothetical protein Tp1100SUR763771_47 [Prokaryotic dsDNA virus sp.]|jgi:hypothetical protein|nr:MAG: hypothetical protein Tp1100SUR763771_47 [Prokaryotic dsDNA virus sp.]|tara:strand:+ start:32571 stop:33170 length:600 start_codon:yes stop_codon:yes gene_type:complete
MLKINKRDTLKKLKKDLKLFERKHLPDATIRSINETLEVVKKGEIHEIKTKIDRPTPFTLKGLHIFEATTKTKHPIGRVFIKRIQEKYLQYQIDGGTSVSQKGKWPIPIDRSITNTFGNLPRGKKRLQPTKDDFYAKIGSTEGIWRRSDTGLKLLIALKKTRHYTNKIFDFYGRGKRIIDVHFNKRMNMYGRKNAKVFK